MIHMMNTTIPDELISAATKAAISIIETCQPLRNRVRRPDRNCGSVGNERRIRPARQRTAHRTLELGSCRRGIRSQPDEALMNAMVTLDDYPREVVASLTNSLYPGAQPASVAMVLAYCAAAKLDPMTKPVHIVPMSVKIGKDKYEWRDVVMPGIELYRTKAVSTGCYAGQDEVVFGPDVTEKWGDTEVTYPQWAKVTVYRIVSGNRVPFTAIARWKECYATAKRDSALPNAMWQKRPYGQLEKCAEALALRKAFPDAIGAHNTVDEMEGKVIDMTRDEAPPAFTVPQARAEPALPPPDAKPQPIVDEPQSKEPVAQPGIDLAEGMRRVLTSKLAGAKLTEQQLVEQFGAVNVGNINKAFAWIKDQQS
jgi:phage recombination protein Bet